MANLYAGTILRVDLSEGKITREPTSSYAADFLGGRGINTKILYDEMPPEIKPLDPEARLIFGAGPLCGTPVSASRTEVTTKSPETGFLGSANFGGTFGPEFKFAGYDHIVITGKAAKPVYLFIYNDRVELRDASHLWGKDTYETQEILRQEIDPEVEVACIGQAGENLVHFASVQHGLRHGAGRTGTGCVMGSKNLKAIAVRGTKGISLTDSQKYLTIVEELNRVMRADPIVKERQKQGQSFMNDAPDLEATKNTKPRPVFSCDLFTKYGAKVRRYGCLGCPSQCMDLFPSEAKGGGAMNCTLYLSPFNTVRNTDLDVELQAGLECLRWGIDIVSAMVMISWLMELYEKGIISARDADGIPMEWGSKEAILGIVRKITFREGFGDVLADGMLQAAEKIGRNSLDYAPHMKGLPLYVPFETKDFVHKKGQALSMAMSSRGDTMRSGALALQEGFVTEGTALLYPDAKSASEFLAATREKAKRISGTDRAFLENEYEGKPEIVSHIEDVVIIVDSLSACKLCSSFNCGRFSEEFQARLFSAGSGIDTSVDKLFEYARKIRNLERAYSCREGVTREMDSFPQRYFDTAITYEGINFEDLNNVHYEKRTSILEKSKFEAMKDRYYTVRGWDLATGIPARETLEKYGLGYVADDLEKRGKLPAMVVAGWGKSAS
jgi:aldehyde:ferredoxin oxidoreductase